MPQIKYCLQCDSPLTNGKCPNCHRGRNTRAISVVDEPQFFCCAKTNGVLCGVSKNLIRVNEVHRNLPPKFWCLKHYEEKRPKTAMDEILESKINYSKYLESKGAAA